VKEYLTGADLFSVLLLMRSTWKGTLLVTEGTTDSRLLDSFIDHEECQIVPGYGKEKVREAIEIADMRSAVGIFGVVDADFENLDGRRSASPNLLLTDHHDFLVMIFNSRALEKFVNNWCSHEKVQRFLDGSGYTDFREAILAKGLPLGLLRRHSHLEGLNLKFHEIRVERFINRDDLITDLHEMVGRVLQRSELTLTARGDIARRIAEALTGEHDPLQICNGHDLADIMSIGVRRALGNLTGAEALSRTQLEGVLRTAYELTDFQKTSLYAEIRRWEGNNIPFVVLAA